jgi:hypothetical protein
MRIEPIEPIGRSAPTRWKRRKRSEPIQAPSEDVDFEHGTETDREFPLGLLQKRLGTMPEWARLKLAYADVQQKNLWIRRLFLAHSWEELFAE